MLHLFLGQENNDQIDIFHFQTFKEFEKYLQNLNHFERLKTGNLYISGDILDCKKFDILKKHSYRLNIKIKNIFSNCRETIIAAQYTKFFAIFDPELNKSINIILQNQKNCIEKTHFGMVRSGDIISSNGNLIIIGDVNPGAFISAKNNIYVWGKLLGVASAGITGENNSSISSLYLNPLQLRINNTIAIGPKEKPLSNYPEIATLEDNKIVINPLIINK
tara:strand:+ start:2610 stop:3269 length:660 start_codon:yes stop_codon:yes gene_type:complete